MPASLGFGTANFIPGYGLRPGQVPGGELIRRSLDAGVRYFDTAASYGAAESVIGDVSSELASAGARLATKVAAADLAQTGVAVLVERVEASATRLRVAGVDTLLFHSSGEAVITSDAATEACAVLRERGLAARTGVSTYGSADAALALAAPWCGAVQIEYSVLNPSVLAPALRQKRHGQELIARSVLCKGLLTSNWRGAPVLTPALEPVLARADALAATWGMTLPELAIRFALDTPGLDVVLVGIGTVEELETALAARDRAPLTASQMAELAALDASDEDATHPERWNHVRTS